MPHTLFLLSPLAKRGGNYCTIKRIRNHLVSQGYDCHLEDPKQFSNGHEFNTVVDRDNIGVLLGIHALRTGAFMKDSSMPYILILGGTDINVFCHDPESMKIMTEAVYKARFVICFSQTIKVKAMSLWPNVSPGRLKVISQAVQTTRSNFSIQTYLSTHCQGLNSDSKRPTVFLFVGGIRPVKNPLYLISTFQEWHAKDRRIIYLIVGPKLDEKYTTSVFEPAIHKLPGVVYIPGLPADDTHAIMSQSFAVVNTSESEGMCLAILEAMKLGVPVIARDIPGNRAIVEDGHTGLLFDSPENEVLRCVSEKLSFFLFYDVISIYVVYLRKNFCEKAQYLLDNEDSVRLLTRNAKDYVHQHHNLEKEKQAYTGLLKQCIEEIDTGITPSLKDLDPKQNNLVENLLCNGSSNGIQNSDVQNHLHIRDGACKNDIDKKL